MLVENLKIYLVLSQQKGQLGRPILDMPYWNAKPSPMPNIGAKYGRKATWIGASGDQTFLRIDEALINSHVLATSEIFASKHIIGMLSCLIHLCGLNGLCVVSPVKVDSHSGLSRFSSNICI